MGKLHFLGIGPKIGMVTLPWLAVSIVLSSIKKDLFVYTSGSGKNLLLTGIVLMSAGLLLYASTVRLLLKGLKDTKLVTNGAYSLCQNPLYATFILLLIPALSLLLNSWLILTTSIVGYIPFRIFIGNEYNELEKFFGESYLNYRNETPEFFPFPLKKWFSK